MEMIRNKKLLDDGTDPFTEKTIPANSMKQYWNILRAPLVSWCLYLAIGFVLHHFFFGRPAIIKTTDILFLGFSLFLALWVCCRAPILNWSFAEAYGAVAVFVFFCSAVTWGLFVISERQTIHGAVQGFGAVVVVILYASVVALVLATLITSVSYVVRSVMQRMISRPNTAKGSRRGEGVGPVI